MITKKSILSFIVFFCLALGVNAETVKGYYIKDGNDTVHAEIVLPKSGSSLNIFKLYESLVILDAVTNKNQTLYPGDISEFGFVYKDKPYVLVSKKFENKGAFVELVTKGTKSSLFSYLYFNGGGGKGYTDIKYAIEKNDGTYLILAGANSRQKLIKKLKEFYKGIDIEKETTTLFLDDNNMDKDMIRLVEDVNNM